MPGSVSKDPMCGCCDVDVVLLSKSCMIRVLFALRAVRVW